RVDTFATVTNSGTIALASTATLSCLDYLQTSAGTLSTHIAGTTPGAGFGQLTATTAALAGTLALATDSGFSPADTDTFAVVAAPSSRTGTLPTATRTH